MSELAFIEKLLDGVSVEWRALGDVLHMRAGQHISATHIAEHPDIQHQYP